MSCNFMFSYETISRNVTKNISHIRFGEAKAEASGKGKVDLELGPPCIIINMMSDDVKMWLAMIKPSNVPATHLLSLTTKPSISQTL